MASSPAAPCPENWAQPSGPVTCSHLSQPAAQRGQEPHRERSAHVARPSEMLSRQSPRDSPSLSPDATQAGHMPTMADSGIPLLPRILFQVEAVPLSGAQPAHPFPAPAGGWGGSSLGPLPQSQPRPPLLIPSLLPSPPPPEPTIRVCLLWIFMLVCVLAKCLLLFCVHALLIYVNEAAL